jgi:hypothetical protein
MDNSCRPPPHAHRRRTLRQAILEEEFSALAGRANAATDCPTSEKTGSLVARTHNFPPKWKEDFWLQDPQLAEVLMHTTNAP